jgi:hypothetical protein
MGRAGSFYAVPTRVATLYKFECHSSHKADRDFQHGTTVEPRYKNTIGTQNL